jgi:dCMP deaminase
VKGRPGREFVLMQAAVLWSMQSTCSRADVGAVISRDGRILSSGYNGAPSGMPHCDHSCDCNCQPYCLNKCRSLQPCRNVVHAEANAIAFAAKYGVGIQGAELHTTRVPCLNCAGMIINAGIKRVVWGEEHRDMEGFLRLGHAGLEVIRYE